MAGRKEGDKGFLIKILWHFNRRHLKEKKNPLVMWKWFCAFPNPFVLICFPYIWYSKHPLISEKNGHVCASMSGSSSRKFGNKLILEKYLPVHSGSISYLVLPHDFHHLRRYFEGFRIWWCNKIGNSADSNQHSNSVTVEASNTPGVITYGNVTRNRSANWKFSTV